MAIERVLLWGFMASGKTEVGGRLARRLGWEHVDLDQEIVQRAGKPIARIFREDGEERFRSFEAEVTHAFLGRTQTIFSPGGGWVTNEELRKQIPRGTLTVWLRVEPETVLERLQANPGGPERPLLSTPDPAARIRQLLADREAAYATATHVISTDARSVESIVDELQALVRANLSKPGSRVQMTDG